MRQHVCQHKGIEPLTFNLEVPSLKEHYLSLSSDQAQNPDANVGNGGPVATFHTLFTVETACLPASDIGP